MEDNLKWDEAPEISEWDTEAPLINVEKDTDNSGLEEMEDPKYASFVEKTYQIIHKVEQIGLPKPGHQLRLVTFRTFNASLFLSYICEKETVEELLLVVYSINGEAAKLIESLVKSGKVKNAIVLMSNLRNKAHRQKEQITRDLFVNNPNIELFFAQSHGKIMAMKTESGNYYSIEGSGNLSFNSRVEQYIIDNDKHLFEFTKDWMQKIKIYLKGKKELIIT